MSPSRASGGPWVAVAIGAVCLGLAMFQAASSPAWSPAAYAANCTDALLFRSVTEVALAGGNPWDPAAVAAHISATRLGGEAPPYAIPFAYPPWALALFSPTAIGLPRWGFLAFVALTTGAALTAWTAWVRQRVPGRWGWVSLLLGGLASPLLFNAYMGQTGAMVVALALGLAVVDEDQPALEGLLLGLSAIKPHYAIFLAIPAILDGRWKALGVAATVIAIQSAAVTAWLGPDIWASWGQVLLAPNPTVPYMSSWVQLGARVVDPATLQPLLLPVLVGGWVAAIIGATRVDPRLRLPLCAGVMLLVSPNTHAYDLGLWLLLLAPLTRGPRWLGLAALAVVTLIPMAPGMRWSHPLVTLGLLAVGVYASRGRPPGSAGMGVRA